jgi:hypothetical protein
LRESHGQDYISADSHVGGEYISQIPLFQI